MELEKKTTILFPSRLHRYLSILAKQKNVSMGFLVRKACEIQYGYSSPDAEVFCRYDKDFDQIKNLTRKTPNLL